MLFSSGCNTPMVSVKPLAEVSDAMLAGQYAVIMRGRHEDRHTGCLRCDFRDATLSFRSPKSGEDQGCAPRKACHPADESSADGRVLLFGETLLQCAGNEIRMSEYTFFDYLDKESLHLSAKEKEIVDDCMSAIHDEYEWEPDKYSCRLVVKKIDVLLTLCKRFYDRQIMTRSAACRCIMKKIENATDRYILEGNDTSTNTDPAPAIASTMQMSPAYLRDYVLFETGFTMPEYARQRRFMAARELLLSTDETVASIARRLGFGSACSFAAIFKRVYGYSPTEARNLC